MADQVSRLGAIDIDSVISKIDHIGAGNKISGTAHCLSSSFGKVDREKF